VELGEFVGRRAEKQPRPVASADHEPGLLDVVERCGHRCALAAHHLAEQLV
jgi:hypothetical protein